MNKWFARWPVEPAAAWAWPQDAVVYRSEDEHEACVYLNEPLSAAPAPVAATLVRLQPLQVLAGAAAGTDAPWHYVVATDVWPEHEADFNRWYECEHLPGLAAVPGVVRAARYRVTAGDGPRYFAGYDLADRAAFNGPAWLAVRGTAWSSRVRPAFFNTWRTMYRRALPAV